MAERQRVADRYLRGSRSLSLIHIYRLAAEYADELNNLGVRVAELEKKSDNVKLEGLLRLDAAQLDEDGKDKDQSATAKLRLNITAKVNDDWEVKGRIDADSDLEEGGTLSLIHIYYRALRRRARRDLRLPRLGRSRARGR